MDRITAEGQLDNLIGFSEPGGDISADEIDGVGDIWRKGFSVDVRGTGRVGVMHRRLFLVHHAARGIDSDGIRGHRRGQVDEHLHRLGIDFDGIGAVFGGGLSLRQDNGDWLPGIGRFVGCQRPVDRGAVLIFGNRQITGGEDGDHTRDCQGSSLVDALDSRVCVRAADQTGVQQAMQLQVSGELLLTCQLLWRILSLLWFANCGMSHHELKALPFTFHLDSLSVGVRALRH